MHLDHFNSSIRNLIRFFEDYELCHSVVCPNRLTKSPIFNQLNLTSQDYVAIYDQGLSISHYNLLLTDLAYFQFSWDSEHEYALAYYLNPRLTGSADALLEFRGFEKDRDDGTLTDEEFDDLVSIMPARVYVPRIRFEYSSRQYRPVRHPGAHFHIGMSGQDRWCSDRKLSPCSFGLLMAKFYYHDIWWPNSRFDVHPEDQNRPEQIESCLDEKLLNSIRADSVSHHLIQYEKETFHFSALR